MCICDFTAPGGMPATAPTSTSQERPGAVQRAPEETGLGAPLSASEAPSRNDLSTGRANAAGVTIGETSRCSASSRSPRGASDAETTIHWGPIWNTGRPPGNSLTACYSEESLCVMSTHEPSVTCDDCKDCIASSKICDDDDNEPDRWYAVGVMPP